MQFYTLTLALVRDQIAEAGDASIRDDILVRHFLSGFPDA